MSHPYVDGTIRLAQQGIRSDDSVSVVCETGEGLVHRLWEPLAAKHQPPSGYAAKFSMPYCMAVGFYEGDAGLAQFSDDKARDPRTWRWRARSPTSSTRTTSTRATTAVTSG